MSKISLHKRRKTEKLLDASFTAIPKSKMM